jgi:hypothetical protein
MCDFVVPAAPGVYGASGYAIVAWKVWMDRDEASPVYAPDVPTKARTAEPDYAGLEVLRTDRCYKKQSFWRFKNAEHDFLFTLPPDTEIPNDERVSRVPGNVYEKMKKELPVVAVERLFDGSSSEPEPEPEPEPYDDDDDGMDMI